MAPGSCCLLSHPNLTRSRGWRFITTADCFLDGGEFDREYRQAQFAAIGHACLCGEIEDEANIGSGAPRP